MTCSSFENQQITTGKQTRPLRLVVLIDISLLSHYNECFWLTPLRGWLSVEEFRLCLCILIFILTLNSDNFTPGLVDWQQHWMLLVCTVINKSSRNVEICLYFLMVSGKRNLHALTHLPAFHWIFTKFTLPVAKLHPSLCISIVLLILHVFVLPLNVVSQSVILKIIMPLWRVKAKLRGQNKQTHSNCIVSMMLSIFQTAVVKWGCKSF